MSACAGRVTAASLALLVAAAPACAKKANVSLEMTREVVISQPTIREVSLEPSGRIDTTDAGRTISVRMSGDPALQATFDVDGRLKDQKMREVEPGVYEGSFEVPQGDTGQLWVTTHLLHPPTGARRDQRGGVPLELTRKLGEPAGGAAAGACDAAAVEAFDQALRVLTTRFEFDRFSLTDQARDILDHSAEILASRPLCRIEIHGYADDVGTPAYNVELSKHRATTVAGYLESTGVPVARMTVFFHGESDPVDTTGSPEGRALNRRVELHAAAPL